MKNLIKILALVMILIVTACSAEIVDNLAKEEISEVQASYQINGAELEILFNPSPYAEYYAYSLDDGSTKNDITDLSVSSDNMLKATLRGITTPNGTVILYAMDANDSNSDWVEISKVDFEIPISSIAPDAYLSRKSQNSIEIRISPIFDIQYLKYKVEIYSNNSVETTEFAGTNLTTPVLKVDGLTAEESYTARVYHGYATEGGEYGIAYQEIQIPQYDDSIDSSIDLELSDTGFIVSNSEATSFDLYKRTSSTIGEGTLLNTFDFTTSSGEHLIPFEDLNSLESGYFYVTESGNKNRRSNLLRTTTPLDPDNGTLGYKGVTINFTFANDVNVEGLRFSVTGAQGATANANGDSVIITGLDSNTTYSNLSLVLNNSEYSSVPALTLPEFTTKSFAGTYRWSGEVQLENGERRSQTNFVLDVRETTNGSDYPYYIFYNDEDDIMEDRKGEEIRIMPLVDTSIGEPATTLPDGVNCSDPKEFTVQNYAYLTNAAKWNATDFPTQAWHINNVEKTHDSVTTDTWSKAMGLPLNGTLSTSTTFSFIEVNGEPYLKFVNSGSSVVSIGLLTNANPENIEGSSDIHTWYLRKVN